MKVKDLIKKLEEVKNATKTEYGAIGGGSVDIPILDSEEKEIIEAAEKKLKSLAKKNKALKAEIAELKEEKDEDMDR